MVLLKYSRTQERIRDRTKIMPSSQLDEFHLYRTRDYSYYFSDELKPNMIGILPGGAGELRRKAYTQHDRHGVRAYRAGSFVEVHCLYDRDVPIYIPVSDIGNRVCVLVEGLPALIWLIGPVYTDVNERRLHSYYAQFADLISYWLWQMTPSLAKYFEGFQVPMHPMIIYLDIPVDEAWFSNLPTNAIPTPPEKAVPLSNIADGEFSIRLVIGVDCMKAMIGTDNRGERSFMSEVLRSLRLLLERFNAPRASQLDEKAIEGIIEKHAPLGIKKKLLVVNTAMRPELDPRGIPIFRKVQHSDANCLLDELGAYLLSSGYGIGDIHESDREKTLRKVVEYLYSRMESMVAALDPREVLDWLIAYNEANIRDMWFTRLTIPTRIACFGNQIGLVKELMRYLTEVYTASLANRVLIEYTASHPPSGMRAMSLDIYDQLMAIASEIVNWGFTSDLLHYKIFDEKLSILPSERLGINREPFIKARSLFMSEHAERQVEGATRSFEKFWTRSDPTLGDSDRKEVEKIDAAFETEFGVSLTQLAAFIGNLYELGMDDPNPAKTFEYPELVDALCKLLVWNKRRVESVVDLMAIHPRNDFMRPPSPFRKADVYPWIFNRRLSYMRRPLLIQSIDGSTKVRWGNRHLINSFEHLVGLCLSGHLKGESPEITGLMTRFRNEASDAFNEEVAKIIRSYPQLIVKSKVNKILGRRIGSPGDDLGDIDVLVVFPSKRKILLVETKKLALAGTPREISNELNELFRGTETKRSTVEKHERRKDWVKTNIDKVLAHFGVSQNGSWQVEPIIVLDNEAFSRHLFPSPIPVVVFPSLDKDFLSMWYA